MKAYDLLVQCESGLASITGSPDQPGRVGVSICDIACGMYAYAAILEALLERQKTGRGVGIEVSLFDAIDDWMSVPLLHQDYGGKAPERVGLNHPSIAPYGAYTCKEGGQLVISIQNNREWRNFCEKVLRKPALVEASRYRDNVDRCANRPALNAEINAVFSTLARRELIERLNQGRIAFGSVNSIAELSRHPQLRRTTVTPPSGPVDLVAPPPIASDGEVGLRAVPARGQPSEAIRKEYASR